MKIFKYEIPIKNSFEINIPKGYKILSLQTQNDDPYIWVMVNENNPIEEVRFVLLCTGEEFPYHETFFQYIDTFQIIKGKTVFHLFKN